MQRFLLLADFFKHSLVLLALLQKPHLICIRDILLFNRSSIVIHIQLPYILYFICRVKNNDMRNIALTEKKALKKQTKRK